MTDENIEGDGLWHVRGVELGEAEGCFAQFAVLLLGMGEPFHEAILVNILDAATAFARVEQGLIRCSLASAYSTGVGLDLGSGILRGGVSGGYAPQ